MSTRPPGPRTARPSTCSFGSGKVGMMGTGNFNITLVRSRTRTWISASRCCRASRAGQAASFAGGDIVTIPKG